MGITISRLPDFERVAENARKAAEKELEIQLKNEIREIDRRTRSGKDAEDNAFSKYSDQYRKYKVEKRKRNNTVDLTLSGEMLAAMNVVEVRRTGKGLVGIIKFATALAAAKARGHMEGLGKNKVQRRFFALAEKQIQKISDGVRAAIIEAMNKKL